MALRKGKDERRAPDGGVRSFEPSRFITEIPPDCLCREDVGFL